MKPIKLKIKGLNSFIDMQEINFEQLTVEGLFGIFGPTGSGKSTILDGITLALYGEISRKSTNYMNTNCDSMLVSYEFQMTDKEVKHYRVDREFRRDAKTGNVRTRSAIFIDVTEDRVLEDKIRSVTEKCEEIIGLKLDDFTRTVVLPQGKFSEFLKLEGKDRREMLERLFNLQKYGDELSFKLGLKIREENQKSNILDGELSTYGDVSNHLLDEKNKLLDETKSSLKVVKEELEHAEKAYNEGKELWQLLSELDLLKSKEKTLKESQEEITLDKIKVSALESALKVKPYLDSFESTLKEINEVKAETEFLNKKLNTIKENKKTAEIQLDSAKHKKETLLPSYKIKEKLIMDAIEEKKALSITINENKVLKEKVFLINDKISVFESNLKNIELNSIKISEDIEISENQSESLKIPEEFKNKVNEGLMILNECESIKRNIFSIEKDINTTKTVIEEAKEKSEKLLKLLAEKEKLIESLTNKLDNLNENCPGDQDLLLSTKEKLTFIRDKWNKHKEYSTIIDKSNKDILVLKSTIENKSKEKLLLLEKINKLKKDIKEIETENLAHSLRESLNENGICPVCGSKEDHKENLVQSAYTGNFEELNTTLKDNEKNHDLLNTEIIKIEERFKTEENIIKDNTIKLSNLGEDYKSYSVEILQNEFEELYKAINKYNLDKVFCEKELKDISEKRQEILAEYNNANSKIIHNKGLFDKLKVDLQLKNNEYKEESNKLTVLKNELSVHDFKRTKKDMDIKEKEKEKLEKEIKNLRVELKDALEKKEKLSNDYNKLKVEVNEKNAIITEKSKIIEEKRNNIINKVGQFDNLLQIKDSVQKEIILIENQFNICEKKKDEIELLYSDVNNKIISFQGNLLSLQERSSKDKDLLNKVLIEEGIKDVEEAKKNFVSKSEIEKLKIKIENYNNSLAELLGALRSIDKKINNRNLTLEQWNELQKNKNEKTLILNKLEKTAISLEIELKSIIVKLQVKNELLRQKQKLEHKMALLNDLDKLFRGKKFVEFVATNQLKYVSIEASKELKEITGGTYGLEVDENGKFLIRDYKNGGAQRDATTLSGGETFVASLALALALSSQIQLKGTHPLELFFLDEGFGSLDDNLLDVVMDSLERIHHSRLSIGIISHLESIKNRVPVKLIVTPAVAGLGGSKVKIEKS